MRKQPYPVTQITGGVNVSLDATFLVDKASPNLRCVWFDKGLIKKDLGRAPFGTGLPLAGTVMLIDTFPMMDGTIHNLMVTTNYVYRYIPASNTYEVKSLAFTGDEDNQFCGVVALDSTGTDTYVLTNGKDNIKHWHGDAGNFTDLGGWDSANIRARQLAYFQSRLIAGFTIESGNNCPWRVRWSVAGDIEDITGTGSGFVEFGPETADWIVALVPLKNRLFVFKERSIWELVYVGGTDVFKPVCRIEGVGTYSPHGVVNLGEELVFYGSDNVYIYDGLDLVAIGKNVYPYLYETENRIVNGAKANRVAATYIEELKKFIMVLPPAEGNVPNLEFSYQFDEQAWTIRQRESTAIGFYSVPTKKTWLDLVGTWNDQNWVWMEKALPPGAPTTLFGTSTGYIYEDDRLTKSSDTAYFETKDWVFEHAQRWVEIRVQARGGPFDVYYSLDEGHTWYGPTTFPYTSIAGEFKEHVVWVNKTSQKLRVKIQTTAEDLEVKWIEPWYIPRKRSKTLVTS